MADDLVDRLRDAGYVLVSPGMRKLAHEAAARIEALEAECADLRHDMERARDAANEYLAALAEAEGRVKAITIAMHDAIRRPMGQVPESADPFYSPAMAEQAEARRVTRAQGS